VGWGGLASWHQDDTLALVAPYFFILDKKFFYGWEIFKIHGATECQGVKNKNKNI
jgi:hypothetical protein